MRFLYLPNEPDVNGAPFRQGTGRVGFEALREKGRLTALETYSYYQRLKELGNPQAFTAELVQLIASFRPDIIFVQHVPRSGLAPDLWSHVRKAAPSAALIYHEADVYGRLMKRFHEPLLALAAEADLTILCTLGYVYDALKSRSRALAYLPHCYDGETFGQRDPGTEAKRFDAVLIGNRVQSRRLRWMSLPGGELRAELARQLTRELGARFGLYGGGWTDLPSQGAIAFTEQERVIQSARLSVNWDHFHTYPYYFSDRLPISLAAGVPHVTSYHPGYEQFFAGCPGLYWSRSIAELIDCVRWLLCKSDAELMDEGLAARRWVAQRLEGRATFERAFEMSLKALARRRAGNHG